MCWCASITRFPSSQVFLELERAAPRDLRGAAPHLSVSKHFQVGRSAGLLRDLVDAIADSRGFDKVCPEVRNVFQKGGLQPQPNMVEENQVLVDLSHVANVRYDGKIVYLSQETDS